MLLLLILIVSILIGPFVDTVYKGREKTTEGGVVNFLNKVCELELEKYIRKFLPRMSRLR